MKLKLAFTVLLSIVLQNLFAQTPKTLLWKVSGGNFTKPCYLYGTMHSRDKRVYYLGDSVYSSLKYCDGFAMEIDPGELIDTMLNSMNNEEYNITFKTSIENDLVKPEPSAYRIRLKQVDSAMQRIRERYRDLSQKDINRLERAYRRRNKNDMRTLLDLFLFDMAKRQGKVIGGVEDVYDQTSIKDELGNSFDPFEFLDKQRKKYVDVEEWMIDNYTGAELDNLEQFSKESNSKRELTMVLYNRNDKMARRIDSLGNIRSTFCAVGAAHLPGDSGLINLLRKKGFTVTPVFSSKKIEPGDIKIEYNMQNMYSVSDADSNYIVQLPGKSTSLSRITNWLVVKTYKELSNEILLMHGVYEDGNLNNSIDKIVNEIKNNFRWYDVKLYSTDKIKKQEIDGYEMNFKNQDGYIKLHIFYNNGKTYMFAAGSRTKDSVNAARCISFLGSYKMLLNRPSSASSMINYIDPGKAFMVNLPTQPKKENVKGDVTYTREDITLFSSYDNRNKISYLVMVKEPFKGYHMDLDTAAFVQTLNEIKKGLYSTVIAEEEIKLGNIPALKVKIRGENSGKSHVIYTVTAVRDNRMYNLTARGLAIPENEALFDKFISSFDFLPYLETKTDMQKDPAGRFSVSAPSVIYEMDDKTSNRSGRHDYFAFDSTTAMSYGITSVAIGKYYWAPDEKSLLNDYSKIYFNDSLAVNNVFDNDSLVYNSTVNNGRIEGKELLIKNLYNGFYSRLRILHYADSIFILNIKAVKGFVTDRKADDFFSSFRFSKEEYSTTAFNSKTNIFLKDLQSTDSLSRGPAILALRNGFRFPEQDMQSMAEGLLHDYAGNKNDDQLIRNMLAKSVGPYSNETLLAFIRSNYPLLKNKREDIRAVMAGILAGSLNADCYRLLKSYLLTDPPADIDYSIISANLNRSATTARILFPELAEKIKDESLSAFVIGTANMLIDSNKLSMSDLKNYEDDISKAGKKMLRRYQLENRDNFYMPYTDAMFQMLAKLNNKLSKGILNDFMELNNDKLTFGILAALVKNNVPVSADVLDKLCKDPGKRIELYDEFAKIDKQSFFKGEYANQRSFAEAFASIYTDERVYEDAPKYYTLISIKDGYLGNILSRFYVFKVDCQLKRGEESYTCITGPFSTNPSEFSIKQGKELYILYKQYNAKNTDNLFNDFLDKANKVKK